MNQVIINPPNPNPNPTPSSPSTPELIDSLEAYESIEAELLSLKDEELAIVNVDIMFGVTTVLGCIPELKRFRSELIAQLPDFDIERFDKLETYARAAGHAHALHLRAAASPDLTPLAEDAAQLRELLLADASALGRRGLIDAHKLAGLKGPVGYRNLAFDLSALSSMLREVWPTLEGKTAITPHELSQARLLADRLLTSVGLREQAPSATSTSALARQRAFTLFVRAYDQTRRAFAYLRWDEDDLDEIVPSLYERRGSRRKSASSDPDLNATTPLDDDAPKPSANATAKTAGPAPSANGAPLPTKPSVAVGLPGGNPFDES